MDVLVTGATGYVGAAIADALLAAGHRVSGLARSDGSVKKLEERGIEAIRGDIADAESVAAAVRKARADAGANAGAVVHAATTHGEEAEAADRAAVGAILDVLRGTGGTFVYTSGAWVMGSTPQRVALADEATPIDPTPMLAWRPAVERWVLGATGEGVRAFVVRPALVYGEGGGIIEELAGSARERGAARFVVPPESAEGGHHWTLVHRDDLGGLYARLLAREAAEAPGGTLLVAAGDGPYEVRAIAEAASRAGGAGGRIEPWPLAEAREELGSYADALALDQRLSGEKARRLLNWPPSAPSVFADLEGGSYT